MQTRALPKNPDVMSKDIVLALALTRRYQALSVEIKPLIDNDVTRTRYDQRTISMAFAKMQVIEDTVEALIHVNVPTFTFQMSGDRAEGFIASLEARLADSVAEDQAREARRVYAASSWARRAAAVPAPRKRRSLRSLIGA